MKSACALVVFALLAVPEALRASELSLVENGEPRAEIVIAEQPPRSVRLAAHELQSSLRKISGAKLPITTKPTTDVPVQVYVGRSPHTDRLGVKPDGLTAGAFRIVSGKSWLVLIGDDTDFTPIEPWARNNADIASGQLQRDWDKITGNSWGVPNAGMYKHRGRLPGATGLADGAPAAKGETLDLWGFDERGSFNAVCGLLYRFGMRWYMPGELGEIVPEMKTIPLPRIDATVKPDFAVRRFNFRLATGSLDTGLWAMRLGTRDPYDILVGHGLHAMTHRDEIFQKHPDWFALYGGKRQTKSGERLNQLCYSNEELFRATVRYARAQLDHFKFTAVSVMPPDGYTSLCQCPLCMGKDALDRGPRGALSDHVWDFVNRVAREVGKTHPDKKVLNCAYGPYTLPPSKIDRLEPNVQVCIVGGRRPMDSKPAQQEELRKLRAAWAVKTTNPILFSENYPFTDRGWYLPAFVPHTIGASVNATKGQSLGEDIWLSIGRDFDTVGIGFNHFLVYFTAQMYWGGKERDIDALFREYCRLFYGPAEKEMLAFFLYCEENWQEMEKDKAKTDAALGLFAVAKAKADPGTVYGKRLALVDDFLKGVRNKSTLLAQTRGPVPTLRLGGQARGKIVIDGKLDDEAWVNCPPASTGRLAELHTGRPPAFSTTVKTAWSGNNLYFAVRCDERPGEKPNSASTKKDDPALWYGDVVEFLIETESRSYYQIAVNPAGVVADVDRSAARGASFDWDAQAEVATHVADDHWTIEIRIPVTPDENDPLHQVIGHKPTVSLPWHVNVCRQRVRDSGQEHSALSPTGVANFHVPLKFAHFYDGRSHSFETGPDEGFLAAYRAASGQLQQQKFTEAITAYTALAGPKATDYQKSVALEQAVVAARAIKKEDLADELTARIPIAAVRKVVQMERLLAAGKASESVAQFGNEDIAAWPFWKAGAGYFTRGRAYAQQKEGMKADADLTRSLEFFTDARLRQPIHLASAQNREHTLKDDARALAAYRSAIGQTAPVSGADGITAVLGAARILTRKGQFDEALAELKKAGVDALRGVWRGSVLLAAAETLEAAGRKPEALAAYGAAAKDELIEPRQRRDAGAKANKLAGK